MTREQLRAQMLANADQASNSLLWRWMSPQQRNLLIAGRQVNSQDTPAVNAYLDLILAQLKTMQALMAMPMELPPAKPTAEEIGAMYATLYTLVVIVKTYAAIEAPAPAPARPTAEEVSAMLRTVFLLVEITSPDSLS